MNNPVDPDKAAIGSARAFTIASIKGKKTDAAKQPLPASDNTPEIAPTQGHLELQNLADLFDQNSADQINVNDPPPDWMNTGAVADEAIEVAAPPTEPPPTKKPAASDHPSSTPPTTSYRRLLWPSGQATVEPAAAAGSIAHSKPADEPPATQNIKKGSDGFLAKFLSKTQKPPAPPPTQNTALQKNPFPRLVAAVAVLLACLAGYAVYIQDKDNQAVMEKIQASRKAALDTAAKSLAAADPTTPSPQPVPLAPPNPGEASEIPQDGEARYKAMLDSIEKNPPTAISPMAQPPSQNKPQASPNATPNTSQVAQLDQPIEPVPSLIETAEQGTSVPQADTRYTAFGEIVAVSNLPYVFIEARQSSTGVQALIGHKTSQQAVWLSMGAVTVNGYTVVRIDNSFVILLTPENRPIRLAKYTP